MIPINCLEFQFPALLTKICRLYRRKITDVRETSAAFFFPKSEISLKPCEMNYENFAIVELGAVHTCANLENLRRILQNDTNDCLHT